MKDAGDNWIVHICRRAAWQDALDQGVYAAESLIQEGFIHCSRPSQVLSVANHFFPQEQELVLLWLDPELVKAEIRWETADGQRFPHIYGSINLEAVQSVEAFPPDENGIFSHMPGDSPAAVG